MNAEIKEIIDYISLECNEEWGRQLENYILDLKQENERLNNVTNGMEKFFEYEYDNEVRPLNDRKISVWTICLDKLKQLKESGENDH